MGRGNTGLHVCMMCYTRERINTSKHGTSWCCQDLRGRLWASSCHSPRRHALRRGTMFGSSASRWRAEFLEGSYATSPQSIVSGVPAVGALPMARLKQPAAVIMPGTGAATLELPYRQGEPKVFVSSFTPTSPLEPHGRADRHSLSLSTRFTRQRSLSG
ncbi:hypothetical protein BN1708_012336 [Verticillium longisporum]|uniref:Uncharacterized protein n=1 Tax=Verticillium longisporum TaxID=100787 RepID=A0A0G4L8S8_VERLO|nr:hypothetical protein BN1708_012336 [Verticillium longisporum]